MLLNFEQAILKFAPNHKLDITVNTKVINFDFANDKLIVDYEILLKDTSVVVSKGVATFKLSEVMPPSVESALSATSEAMYQNALFVK